MQKRVCALLSALVVVLGGISGRIYYLSQSSLQTVSSEQSSRQQTMAVSRGTIYDRYLQPLVNCSEEVVASVSSSEECVQAVSQVLTGEERGSILERLTEGERVLVMTESWLPPTVGIMQIKAPVRYDENAVAQHVIGYVNGENCGVTGIEKGYDEQLMSYSGKATVSYQIDALGRVSSNTEDTLTNTLDNSIGGVALTLDAQLQTIVQTTAASYMKRGAVVVSDAKSGEVLASVSLPLYDQNNVAAALEEASSPLLDRTLINYNCGSVFKIITAAAALENGISTKSTYTCTGAVTVNGIVFRCHNPLGDGALTMDEAMAVSCNCYFIQLALDVGAQAIYHMAERAGFSQAITLANDLQTSRALLPSARDLSSDAALANFCIGQGELMASVYHLNSLVKTVVNDGLWYPPTLYFGEVSEDNVLTTAYNGTASVRLFSSQTAQKLQKMLELTVESGTGTAALPTNLSAAGKTGTAETGWEINGEEVVQSWFSGYYPAWKPQFVITVLSENGGANSKTAAPLFALVCNKLFAAGLVENTQELY